MSKIKKTIASVKKISAEEIKKVVIEAMQDKKALEIISIDLKATYEGVTDYFIICHGESTTQVNAISEFIQREVKEKLHENPYRSEGTRNAQWVILDYFDVVVHVFYKDAREFYRLEDMWSDAPVERHDLEENTVEQNIQKLKTTRTRKLNGK